MNETQNPIASHLFDKLAETADKLRCDGTVDCHNIAVAFLAVGITLARHEHGPAMAAEWLRDIADETERGDPVLNRSLN